MRNRIFFLISLIIGYSFVYSISLIPINQHRISINTVINKIANAQKGNRSDLKEDTIIVKSVNSNSSLISESGEEYFFDSNGIFTSDDKFLKFDVGDELIIYYLFNTIYLVNRPFRKAEWIATKEGDDVKYLGGNFFEINGTLYREKYESLRKKFNNPDDYPDFETLMKNIKEKKLCKIIKYDNNSSQLTCLAYSPANGKQRIGGYYGVSDNMVRRDYVKELLERNSENIYLKALNRTVSVGGGCSSRTKCAKTLVMLSTLINNNSILVDGDLQGPSLKITSNIKDDFILNFKKGGGQKKDGNFNKNVKVILSGGYGKDD